MDYIWIILLAISAIIIAVYSKKVDKAEHPASYKKEGKKEEAEEVKAQVAANAKRLAELEVLEEEYQEKIKMQIR